MEGPLSPPPDGSQKPQRLPGFVGVQQSGSGTIAIGRDLNIRVGNESPARAPCHNIPFPRNEALVDRGGIFSELERLLPARPESQSAALWGLGGSGKTQMALEYAYRRWHSAPCSVFWVHADNETTFAQDYQLIAKKLDVPADVKGEDLLAAVRIRIEAEPRWVLVVDNADDLGLFGVGRTRPGENQTHARATETRKQKWQSSVLRFLKGDRARGRESQSQARATEQAHSLQQFVPRGPAGTVLWTSRDKQIGGSLVVAQRTINVARMEADEARTLLETTMNKAVDYTERDDALTLLAELDWLPLAISQAAAYMRRTETSIREYLSKLTRAKKRWRILQESEPDVHRRREVSNSVLETLSISIRHIRQENEIAYKVLHILAFLDNQNIPVEMVKKAAKFGRKQRIAMRSSDSEDEDVIDAVARLREFSFLSPRMSESGSSLLCWPPCLSTVLPTILPTQTRRAAKAQIGATHPITTATAAYISANHPKIRS